MSRVMEIVSDDDPEIIAKRTRKAFKRIGKIDAYDPTKSLHGRVSLRGYTATVQIVWGPYKNRTRLDISASSDDQLSRAADEAMYHFLDEFRSIHPDEVDIPDPRFNPRKIFLFLVAFGLIAWVGLRLIGAYLASR